MFLVLECDYENNDSNKKEENKNLKNLFSENQLKTNFQKRKSFKIVKQTNK